MKWKKALVDRKSDNNNTEEEENTYKLIFRTYARKAIIIMKSFSVFH